MSTLLIVDDDPGNRLAVEATLAPLGHSLLAASSAHAAWELMGIVQVDLLITDLWMSGMSGSELVELLRASHKSPDIPIVLTTGADRDDPGVRRASALTGVSFLQKPYSPSTLRDLIARLLRSTPEPRYACRGA